MNETQSNTQDGDWYAALEQLKQAKQAIEKLVCRLEHTNADRLNIESHGGSKSVFKTCKDIFEALSYAEKLATSGKEKLRAKWPGQLRYDAEFLVNKAGKNSHEVQELAKNLGARIEGVLRDPEK